ncbi:unnamed protein product [Symbiodinium sp. CCMP2592]|nr:unnamed protein product [Symbiodinium sp. CCMP2592]CAE7525412.1 unnamed protein product [Symbiodinium sp. CCMP2592]
MSMINSNSLRARDVELLIEALKGKLKNNEEDLITFVCMQLEHVVEALRMSTGDWCQVPRVSMHASIVIACFTSARLTVENGPGAATIVLPPADYLVRPGPLNVILHDTYDSLSIPMLKEHIHMVRGTKLVFEQFGSTFKLVPLLQVCLAELEPYLDELGDKMEAHLGSLTVARGGILETMD